VSITGFYSGWDLNVPDALGVVTGARAWRVIFGPVGTIVGVYSIIARENPAWTTSWQRMRCTDLEGALMVEAFEEDGRLDGYSSRGTVVQRSAVTKSIHKHGLPAEDCSCGFYACATPQALERSGFGFRNCVWGLVDLAGRIIVGSKGYRAEKAKIRALVFMPQDCAGTSLDRRTQIQVARSLGVPFYSTWPVHLLTDPEELIPDE